MPEGRCKNKKCNRLIFDTEKLEDLKDRIECQHCHHVNIIRKAGEWVFGGKKPKPEPGTEETTGTEEPEPSTEGTEETTGDEELATELEPGTELEPVEPAPGAGELEEEVEPAPGSEELTEEEEAEPGPSTEEPTEELEEETS